MSSPSSTGVLIVWVDLDPSVEAIADDWYVAEHLPERITEAGYRCARRYRALSGSPAYMSVFEASTPEALASEGYRRVTATISPLSQRIRTGFRRCIRSTHCMIAVAGTARGGLCLCVRLDFDDATERAHFEQWAATELASWVGSRTGVLAARALAPAHEVRRHMDSFRATGQQDEWADCVLLLELARMPEANAELFGALTPEAFQQRGARPQAATLSLYQLMVEFS